ncbi:hypothetical protein LPMP_342970 [Leishmania panamensis]|uniref:Guanine nucleotide-binding protein subunit beta-like protein n=1 Tax=Leishmania panamensis TaxID=5679 RepID=A0A088S0J1_LEIPA|nr:hypothetical protein LPMP_342970 [Leishmania panamensis]AIO01923.1 hypothetical protein LPMP_342970 [Leishmania panamensis]
MRAPQEGPVPRLAIVLGSEVSLVTLQQEWAAFPQGVSYAEFRQLLEPHIRPHPCFSEAINANVALLHSCTLPLCSISASSPSASPYAPGKLPQALSSAPVVPAPAAFDDTSSNRESERTRRIRTRQELAGVTTRSVDPIKHLFNRIDVHNQQRVTWEELVNYLVAEASIDAAGKRLSTTTLNRFTFSRLLRGQSKRSQEKQKIKKDTTTEAPTFKRYYRDVQGVPQTCRTRAGEDNDAIRRRAVAVVHEDEDLALIRFLDGLPGHKSLFFASTRSCSFILYSKGTLERVYSAPPEMLPGVSPSAVSYLDGCDLFLCYSSDDRLLRGWFSLLSHAVTTMTVTPLLVEGLVRRIQVMPRESPTYADYTETLFLGNSFGHVLRVVAPHRHSGGMEFKVVQTFSNLHTRESGGLVDFCLYGAHLYSCGFDGRLVATSLLTGKSSDLGRMVNEHFTTLVYVPEHDWVVAATSCGRQLLWWEAHSHGTLPGTPFDLAGHGEPVACIIALIYVAAVDHVVSADSKGVMKVWDASTQRCVQSFRGNRVPQRLGSSICTVPADEAKVPATKTRTAVHPSSGLLTGNLAGLFVNLGLLSLLPTGTGQASYVGGPQCHSLIYCESTQELLCGFVNSIVSWGLRGRDNSLVCDEEEVCYDIIYDIRTRTFLVQGATRLSVWDGLHGHRRGVVSQTALSGVLQAGVDIKAVCIDELGSRVFISLCDGDVVSYTTQDLASDASQCTSATATVWWRGNSLGSGTTGGSTAVVEQMHYSSISRTWIAITSNGALLVRSEEDDQEVLFSVTISVSPSPLSQLRVSEELGLVAVTDAQHTVYIYDMQAWMDAPVTKRLAGYGALVDLVFLGSAPALVTVHAGGVCRCWSCAPVVERFKLLSVFCHPRHPTPELCTAVTIEAERASMGMVERTRLGRAVTTRGRLPMQSPAMAPCLHMTAATTTGGNDALYATAISPLPLGTTLPKIACISRPGSAYVASRPATPRLRVSQYGSSILQQTKSSFEETSADSTVVAGDATSAFMEFSMPMRKSAADALHDIPTGEDWLGIAATPTASVEFTSAAYDGRQHHLFLGDSEGVVHTYRMCPLLQAYRLPRCTHASRPAFSLTVATESTGLDAGDGLTVPTLVWSVQVHVNQSATTEPGVEARPASAYHGSMPTTTQHGSDRCGVVCVRWFDDRGVLATSGYNHEVWFLDSSVGEKVACLSAEQLPSRRDHADRALSASWHCQGTLTQDLMVLSGVLDGQRPKAASTLPPHNTFSLPPLPRYEDLNDDSAVAFLTGVSQPHCCAHHTTGKDSAATEEGQGAVSLSPQSKEVTDISATLSNPRLTSLGFDPLRSCVGQEQATSSHLFRHSCLEATVTSRHDRPATVLKDYMQRLKTRRGSSGRPQRCSTFLSPLPRLPSSQQALAEDVLVCWGPLPHNTSLPAGNPLEEGEYPHSTGSAVLSTTCPTVSGGDMHIYITDWQKRDLMGMRKSRSIKPQAPVPPVSHNTLVNVEESKSHNTEVTGKPLLLGPAGGVSWHAVRTAAAADVAPAVTDAAVLEDGTTPSCGARSLTANVATLNRPQGDAAGRATGPSCSTLSFSVREDSVAIGHCDTVNGSFCISNATSPALALRISGSALAAPVLDADKSAAVHQQKQKPLSQLQQAHGRIRPNFATDIALQRYERLPRVPFTQSSAPGHHSRMKAPHSIKKARWTHVDGKCSSSTTNDVAVHSSFQGITERALSSVPAKTLRPPPMLAYSSEFEGVSTLEMYSSELHQCLRRLHR